MLAVPHHMPLMEPHRGHPLPLGVDGVHMHMPQGVADGELHPRPTMVLAVLPGSGQVAPVSSELGSSEVSLAMLAMRGGSGLG
jgi:hypothetical protein